MEFKVKPNNLKRSAHHISGTDKKLNNSSRAIETAISGLSDLDDSFDIVARKLVKSQSALEVCSKNARDLSRAIEAIASLYDTTEKDIVSNKKKHKGIEWKKLLKYAVQPMTLTNPYYWAVGPLVDPGNSYGLNPAKFVSDLDKSIDFDFDYDEETGRFNMDVTYDQYSEDTHHTTEVLPDGTVIEEIENEGHANFHLDLGLWDEKGNFNPNANANADGYYTGYSYKETDPDGSYRVISAATISFSGAAVAAMYDDKGQVNPNLTANGEAEGTVLRIKGQERRGTDDKYEYVDYDLKVGAAEANGEITASAQDGAEGKGSASVSAAEGRIGIGQYDHGVREEIGISGGVFSYGVGTESPVDAELSDHGVSISASPEVKEGFSLGFDYTLDYGETEYYKDYQNMKDTYFTEMNNYDFMRSLVA